VIGAKRGYFPYINRKKFLHREQSVKDDVSSLDIERGNILSTRADKKYRGTGSKLIYGKNFPLLKWMSKCSFLFFVYKKKTIFYTRMNEKDP